MFLFAVSVHVGAQGGGDLVRRWVLEKRLEDIAAAPFLPKSKKKPSTGGAADAQPRANSILKCLKTPWLPKSSGSLYAGMGFVFLTNAFLQFNGHIGMTGMNEEYFSMPLFFGGECIIGLYLSPKIMIGISGGIELIQCKTHRVDVKMDLGKNGYYHHSPSKRFESLTAHWRYFIGPFFGIQMTSAIRFTGKIHIAPFFSKDEKVITDYSLEQDDPIKSDPIKGSHQFSYGGVRMMLGVELMRRFNK